MANSRVALLDADGLGAKEVELWIMATEFLANVRSGWLTENSTSRSRSRRAEFDALDLSDLKAVDEHGISRGQARHVVVHA
jgi:hypothetical protein